MQGTELQGLSLVLKNAGRESSWYRTMPASEEEKKEEEEGDDDGDDEEGGRCDLRQCQIFSKANMQKKSRRGCLIHHTFLDLTAMDPAKNCRL